MNFDVTFFALAIPAVLFAGISKGGFGSGAAFAATPFLALILEPAQAVGMMLPLLMIMDLSALKTYWRQPDWPTANAMILGSVPGILLGTALYNYANPDFFRLLIGGVAVGFVIYQYSRSHGWIRPAKKPLSWSAGVFAGGVAGFTSFVSHAGGPPAAIYMLSKNLSKTMYQATGVVTFWAINLLKFVPYAVLGIFSKETLTADLYLAPFAFLGVALGVQAHKYIPERVFFGLTHAFLLITGSKLIWSALT